MLAWIDTWAWSTSRKQEVKRGNKHQCALSIITHGLKQYIYIILRSWLYQSRVSRQLCKTLHSLLYVAGPLPLSGFPASRHCMQQLLVSSTLLENSGQIHRALCRELSLSLVSSTPPHSHRQHTAFYGELIGQPSSAVLSLISPWCWLYLGWPGPASWEPWTAQATTTVYYSKQDVGIFADLVTVPPDASSVACIKLLGKSEPAEELKPHCNLEP